MTLLFMDGFDHYSTADITKKWDSRVSSSNSGIYPDAGRRGGGAFQIVNEAEVVKLFPATTTVIVGAALSSAGFPASPATNTGFIRFKDSTTTHVSVHPMSDGSLRVYRGDVTTLLGSTATGVISTAGYQYIEAKVTIDDTAGAVELRVNGVTVLSLTGIDTRNAGNASCNSVRVGGTFGSNVVGYVDDLYICDASGSINNDFLGDIRIDVLAPSGDGTHNDFTASASVADATAAYTYWRLLFKSWAGASRQIYEVEMRATIGGADQCTGGTATSSSGTAANAFDNNGTSNCSFNAGEGWLQYAFASPVSVAEVTLYHGSSLAYHPAEMWLQASNDGVTFKTLGAYAGISMAIGETKSFLTISGTDASLVNELTPDSGGTYFTGGASGTKETFTLTPTTELPNQNLVVAVQVNNHAYKNDAGGAVVKNLIRSGTSEATGADTALTTTGRYVRSVHELNPATGQPWLLSEAQAMEAGLEVVS